MSTSHDSGSPVTEGQEATFTITRTLGSGKTASAQTVYVSTKEGTAGLEDYQSLENLAVDFKADELTKTVVVKTESDSVTDDGEYFFVNLFTSVDAAEEENYSAWAKAFIANDSSAVTTAENYSYTINSSNNLDDGGGEEAAKEGTDITFTITRTKDQ